MTPDPRPGIAGVAAVAAPAVQLPAVVAPAPAATVAVTVPGPGGSSAPLVPQLADDLRAAINAPNLYVGRGSDRKADDPPFIVVFGGTNTSKSTDALRFVAGGGLILTQPGGATTAKTVLGIDVSEQIQHVSTFEELPAWIRWAGENGFTSVYVDDATLLMANSFAAIRKRYTQYRPDGTEKGTDRAMWGVLRPLVTEVGKALRWAGIPGVLTAHAQLSYVHDKDGVYPLGPDLSWGKLVSVLPCEADICLYATGRPQQTGVLRPGQKAEAAPPWDFRCNAERGNPGVATGDRFDIVPEFDGPLNTAEIIREAARTHGYNYHVPRPRGLEWMEDVAESIANSVVIGGNPEREASKPWSEYLLREGHHFTHVRWATVDGIHRARLRLGRQENALRGLI
jgi:hypothetical protein